MSCSQCGCEGSVGCAHELCPRKEMWQEVVKAQSVPKKESKKAEVKVKVELGD